MIEYIMDKDGEDFVFSNDFDTVIPVSYLCPDGKAPCVTLFPSVKDIVIPLTQKYESDLLSDQALHELFSALAPFFAEHGYSDDRFRDRWGYVLRAEQCDIRTEKILPSTLRLTADHEDINITTFDIRQSCEYGLVGYGTVEDGRLVSLAMTHTELPDRPSSVEVGLETAPAYRKRGLGVSNLAALSRHLAQLGHTVEYRCQRYNSASLAAAQSAGFRRVGRYYYYVGRKCD